MQKLKLSAFLYKETQGCAHFWQICILQATEREMVIFCEIRGNFFPHVKSLFAIGKTKRN